ncbi:hypothetical protein Pst134EA_009503 [Puccinia striiformis f. sp. tritici]|uniref:hypothetical protein n=1 Tax=Puccinia striiformis f. sp. tritici TaxID=168172 RepID=UPI0020071FDB|nr:hypothetical protein Pst134EA_009503 [Puccinia striiformis f. sp. tritici]KAH9468978.1 hypothetical protein Pst134EA_009503 [Puccinia striiformis f. sp. tritici]KAI9621389.1 hypothetical protein H4Q26_015685 [Puccinia striiformis f. sp. tritici PST-130]
MPPEIYCPRAKMAHSDPYIQSKDLKGPQSIHQDLNYLCHVYPLHTFSTWSPCLTGTRDTIGAMLLICINPELYIPPRIYSVHQDVGLSPTLKTLSRAHPLQGPSRLNPSIPC